MLEAVIEKEDLYSRRIPPCVKPGRHAIGMSANNDGRKRAAVIPYLLVQGGLEHPLLIPQLTRAGAMAPRQDGDAAALQSKSFREAPNDRRFSGPAGRNVPNADDGARKAACRGWVAVELDITEAYRGRVHWLGRRKQGAHGARARPPCSPLITDNK